MSMATRIEGALSGTGADVNTDRELTVALTRDHDKSGFVVMAGEAHDGAAGVARLVRPADVSHDFRLRAGLDTCLFKDMPGMGSTVPLASKYRTNALTMTLAGSNGWLVINSGNNIASGNYARLNSYAHFSVPPASPLYIDIPFSVSAMPAAGQVLRFGWFKQSASATADAEDGVYIENTAGGVWQGCIMSNGVGSAVPVTLTGFAPVINQAHLALIVVSQYSVDFYIDGVLYGSLPRPTVGADITGFSGQPLTAYLTNGAAGVSTACQLRIGKWGVSAGDLDAGLSYETRMAIGSNGAASFNGVAGAVASNIANSAAPGAAALSNTAAGYSSIDGAFQWAAVAGAETDYALFAYLNPDSSLVQQAQNLLISGARISMRNAGAANSATVPTTVEFYLGVGSTAVSLATTDSATSGTRAPRRTYLGQISIPVNAVVGQPGDREINVSFPPQAVEPNTVVHIIARVVSGAATASQFIRGQASLSKQWAE